MKKRFPFLVILMTIILISCRKQESSSQEMSGRLSINIGLSINVDEVNSGLKSTAGTEDFTVRIIRDDGTEVLTFETASAMPDIIELGPGSYYVEAFSDNNLPAAFENPYYYGASDVFTISSNTQQSVQVMCKLANTIVSVVYSDTLKSSFTNYSTTISSILDSLLFTKDETRRGYFQTLPLGIRVDLTWQNPDGSESTKSISGSIPNPLANHHYEIRVNAAIDNGAGTFQILLDDSEIPVETVNIGEDPAPLEEGAIGYGELLITEIMFDPSSLSDTDGEWIEIYNNSDHPVNLQNLVLERDDTNSHTIADDIELAPGEYFVLARKDTAADIPNMYVYGSAISLPNTGAVLSLYNADSGPLIFSVDYGEAGFPSGSGTSISLNPEMLNAVEAVSGTSWCTSYSIYNTGDLGTPGGMNDSCL